MTIPWNKGLKKKDNPSIAKTGFQVGHPNYNTGRPHTEETKRLMSIARKGSVPWNKGKFINVSAGYNSVHTWLRRQVGSAKKCSNLLCEKDSTLYEYAKIPGRTYERVVNDYVPLCRKCHRSFDGRGKTRLSINHNAYTYYRF